MNTKKIREIIAYRAKVEEVSQGENYNEIEKCWERLANTLCEDINASIRFLQEDCTGDEYSWISEVLDDVAEREGGHEFVECFKSLVPKFSEECKKYNIISAIEIAEAILEEKEKQDEN